MLEARTKHYGALLHLKGKLDMMTSQILNMVYNNLISCTMQFFRRNVSHQITSSANEDLQTSTKDIFFLGKPWYRRMKTATFCPPKKPSQVSDLLSLFLLVPAVMLLFGIECFFAPIIFSESHLICGALFHSQFASRMVETVSHQKDLEAQSWPVGFETVQTEASLFCHSQMHVAARLIPIKPDDPLQLAANVAFLSFQSIKMSQPTSSLKLWTTCYCLPPTTRTFGSKTTTRPTKTMMNKLNRFEL